MYLDNLIGFGTSPGHHKTAFRQPQTPSTERRYTMTVEITSATIHNRVVEIEAINVSEEHLQRIERTRDDGFEQELLFNFDLNNLYEKDYLYRFLHHQKRVMENKPKFLIDALQRTVGTITSISGKYLNYDRAV